MAVNPETSTRKLITFPNELVREIEEFRRTLQPIPSEAEAIRRLVRAGLECRERKKADEAKKAQR